MPNIVCEQCQVEAKVTRKWQKFCSEKCRWEHWQRLHPRGGLSKGQLAAADPCYYCGLPATGVDHVPPQSVRARLIALDFTERFKFVEVPSCQECNSGLGAKSLFTLTERKRYIKAWLLRRYKRVLAMPRWTDSELKDLGPRLQDHVICQTVLAEVVRERIAY